MIIIKVLAVLDEECYSFFKHQMTKYRYLGSNDKFLSI